MLDEMRQNAKNSLNGRCCCRFLLQIGWLGLAHSLVLNLRAAEYKAVVFYHYCIPFWGLHQSKNIQVIPLRIFIPMVDILRLCNQHSNLV